MSYLDSLTMTTRHPVPVTRNASALDLLLNDVLGKSPADQLQHGRENLLTRGWAQTAGEYLNEETGEVCLVGALLIDQTVYLVALEYLAAAAGVEDASQLDDWNDDPARTLDEVLAVYDRAIAAALADPVVAP